MIVVDSSAIIAILEKESDAAFYARAIREADSLVIPAVNAHESAMISRGRRGPEGEKTYGRSWLRMACRLRPSTKFRRAPPLKPLAATARAFTRKHD